MGALVVVGREKSVLERSVGVDPVLVVGIFIDGGRIGTDHGRHTRRKPVGVLGLLLDLFPREVAQRVVRRASLAEINQVLAVVVTVKQAHATCVAGGNPSRISSMIARALKPLVSASSEYSRNPATKQ